MTGAKWSGQHHGVRYLEGLRRPRRVRVCVYRKVAEATIFLDGTLTNVEERAFTAREGGAEAARRWAEERAAALGLLRRGTE